MPGLRTVAVCVELLSAGLASTVVLLSLAVLVSVAPSGALPFTRTTRVKVALPPEASVASVPVTVPVPPTAGVELLNVGPVFCVKDTKVVLGGSASLSTTFWAAAGPVLLGEAAEVEVAPPAARAGPVPGTAQARGGAR